MSDEKLDSFLKKHAPRVPAPPAGEKERIRRAIEAEDRKLPARSWRDWLALPQLRVAVPALATLAIVLGALHVRKARHDAEVDRVLAHYLVYQSEDASGDDALF